MEHQCPRKGFSGFFRRRSSGWGLRRACSGEEVVKETNGIVPFQRDTFECEIAIVEGNIRIYKEQAEEHMQTRKEEREVGEAVMMDLDLQ